MNIIKFKVIYLKSIPNVFTVFKLFTRQKVQKWRHRVLANVVCLTMATFHCCNTKHYKNEHKSLYNNHIRTKVSTPLNLALHWAKVSCISTYFCALKVGKPIFKAPNLDNNYQSAQNTCIILIGYIKYTLNLLIVTNYFKLLAVSEYILQNFPPKHAHTKYSCRLLWLGCSEV